MLPPDISIARIKNAGPNFDVGLSNKGDTYNDSKSVKGFKTDIRTVVDIYGNEINLAAGEITIDDSKSKISSKRRINIDRAPSALSSMSRLAYGNKCDLVFRQYDTGHNLRLEFEGSEARSKMEDKHGTNYIEEGFIKSPRILKDMLDVSLEKVNYDEKSRKTRTVGVLHSSLPCTMLAHYLVLEYTGSDYTYAIWFKLFTKMFPLDTSIVRIKTGESIFDVGTSNKKETYNENKFVKGFKNDIWFVVDVDGKEIDPAPGEIAKDDSKNKTISDEGKLTW